MATTLIATGGTISWHDQRSRMLTGAELAEFAGCRFDAVVDIADKPSWDLSVRDMQAIAAEIRSAIDEGSDAVVVTHGTDTMEETSWLTELLLGAERRRRAGVTFTGAMRFADVEQTDGPRNLSDAAAVATAGAGKGVQIAFAGRVHAARWVVKTDARALDAFDSFGRPPSAPSPPDATALDERVALVKLGPLATPPLPEGMRGLVVEGTGSGHVPSAYHERIHALVDDGIPVVIASRSRAADGTTTDTGVMRSGDLTAEKAALALMAGLGSTSSIDELRAWWSELFHVTPTPDR